MTQVLEKSSFSLCFREVKKEKKQDMFPDDFPDSFPKVQDKVMELPTEHFKDISEIDEEISATGSKIRSVKDPSGAGKPLKSSLNRRLNLLKGAKINFNKTINVHDMNEQVSTEEIQKV